MEAGRVFVCFYVAGLNGLVREPDLVPFTLGEAVVAELLPDLCLSAFAAEM
jgi:hypothetical protein